LTGGRGAPDPRSTEHRLDNSLGGGVSVLPGGSLQMLDVTITDCTATAFDGSEAIGGAVYSSQGEVTLVNVTIADCTASVAWGGTAAGGAVFSWAGHLTLVNVTIADCTASAPGGGNAYGGAVYTRSENATLVGGTITNCTSFTAGNGHAGGGAVFGEESHVALQNVGLADCSASAVGDGECTGGALRNSYGSWTLTNVQISDCTVSTTGSGYAAGGAVYVIGDAAGGGDALDSADLTLVDVVVARCTASTAGLGHANGGAMYIFSSSKATLIDTTITDCSATASGDGSAGGGAIECSSSCILSLRRVHLTRCTASTSGDRYAEAAGGALYNRKGVATLLDTTITDCAATASGGSYAIGGAVVSWRATTTLQGVEIADCAAFSSSLNGDALGGGLYSDTSNVTLLNVDFANCTATSTGGGYAHDGAAHSEPGNATLVNVTFAGCTASSYMTSPSLPPPPPLPLPAPPPSASPLPLAAMVVAAVVSFVLAVFAALVFAIRRRGRMWRCKLLSRRTGEGASVMMLGEAARSSDGLQSSLATSSDSRWVSVLQRETPPSEGTPPSESTPPLAYMASYAAPGTTGCRPALGADVDSSSTSINSELLRELDLMTQGAAAGARSLPSGSSSLAASPSDGFPQVSTVVPSESEETSNLSNSDEANSDECASRPGTLPAMIPAMSDREAPGSHTVVLESVLGRGGFATVWKGKWMFTAVAVKVFHAGMSAKMMAKFQLEAQTLRTLRHPNICYFFDTCIHDGVPVIVLELLNGGTLGEHLCLQDCASSEQRSPETSSLRAVASGSDGSSATSARSNQRTVQRSWSAVASSELLQLAKDVALGLHYLHANGITHRDVKNANVMIDRGQTVHAKLCDFGISALKTARHEPGRRPPCSFNSIGTLRYLPPEMTSLLATSQGLMVPDEQLEVMHHARVDVYSFGLMLYEIMHGHTFLGGMSPMGVAIAASSGTRPPLALRPELAAVGPLILACWEKAAEGRPQMETVVEGLSEILETRGASRGAAEVGPPGIASSAASSSSATSL